MPLSIKGADLVELLERVLNSADKCSNEEEASPSEEDRAVDGLKRLKQWPITTQLLLETQVGKRLRKISKHSNRRISSAASEVLDTWKKTVATEAAQESDASKSNSNSKNEDTRNSNSNSALTNSGLYSPPVDRSSSFPSNSNSEKSTTANSNSVAKPPIKSNSGVENSSRRSNSNANSNSIADNNSNSVAKAGDSTSGIPPGGGSLLKYATIAKIGEVVRDKPRQVFAEALAMVGKEVSGNTLAKAQSANIAKLAVDIEVQMFRKFGAKDMKDYKNKFRSISFNIKDPTNPDLRRRLLLGEVSPSQLMSMSSEDMASDKRKEETAATKKKFTEDAVRGQNAQASTDQFKCGKCGHRKTTYFQLQTRSADEPMTTFVTCVNCNNRWKFC